MRPLLACALLVASCSSPAPDDETGPPPACEHVPSPARRVRVFAVGHHLHVSEGATYASYERAFRQTVEAEVIPHLATDRPNVLVFPESVGFPAAFVGARGEVARDKDSAFLAYVALQGAMPDAFAHYRELASAGGIGSWILLAATDPTWRAFDTTFSSIARDLGVYVVASVDAGDVAAVDDPALAAILGDPERPTPDVFHVPDGKLFNQAVMYGPTGAPLGRMRKVYLTDPEHGELGITGHLPEHVTLAADDVVQVAALISRDAWMPDLQERAAAAGSELVLQHEAFSTWTVEEPGAPWPADNLKRSGWAAVQKHPELRMTAAPMLVGNFFDIAFDGQSFIAVPGTPSMARRALLAQDPDTGWAAIAPWVVDAPAGSLETQRAALRTVGESLLPGGARDGQYREGTVWADLEIPADDGYPVVAVEDETSRAIAPSGLGRQRSASPIVLGDGSLAVAWEDTRFCTGQIVVARSDDGGATFTEPVRVAPWNRAQHHPSLVALDDVLVVAWQEILDDGHGEIRVATSSDRGATWSHRVRVDREHTSDAWVPALAADGGTLYLAFVDSRGEAPNRRIYLTRSTDAGATWDAPLRLDPRERDTSNPDATLTNEWSPAIAARAEHVAVAYTHRERPDAVEQPSWDTHVIESVDGGHQWTAPRRLDLGGSPERIAADPAIALDATGSWQLAFSTVRGAKPDSDIALASTASTELGFAPEPRDAWWPSIAALPDGGVAVAWQDFRDGGNDIYLARAGASTALRIDDAGTTDAQAWRPRIAAAADGSVYVVWEDSRSGHAELRVARVTP
ncbi:MAG TPA: exo-alpha-sialidase [Kofleriaceae bacterium]|nr:exo-alpha-sialidase [Kofleriaceae bacterium]